jgi:hypothetical protein
VCSTRPLRTVGPEPLHPHVCGPHDALEVGDHLIFFNDTAPIPGIIIPGARGKDFHPRSSCQLVAEGVVHLLFFSGVQGDHRPARCGEGGYPRGFMIPVTEIPDRIFILLLRKGWEPFPVFGHQNSCKTSNPCISLESVSWELMLHGFESINIWLSS